MGFLFILKWSFKEHCILLLHWKKCPPPQLQFSPKNTSNEILCKVNLKALHKQRVWLLVNIRFFWFYFPIAKRKATVFFFAFDIVFVTPDLSFLILWEDSFQKMSDEKVLLGKGNLKQQWENYCPVLFFFCWKKFCPKYRCPIQYWEDETSKLFEIEIGRQ